MVSGILNLLCLAYALPSAFAVQTGWTINILNYRAQPVAIYYADPTFDSEPQPVMEIQPGEIGGVSTFYFHTFYAVDMSAKSVVGIIKAQGMNTSYTLRNGIMPRRCETELIGTHELADADDTKHSFKVWNLAGEDVFAYTDFPEGEEKNITVKAGERFQGEGVAFQVWTFEKVSDGQALLQLVVDVTNEEIEVSEHIISACEMAVDEKSTNVVIFDARPHALPVWVHAQNIGITKPESHLVRLDSHPNLEICQRFDFDGWPDEHTTALDHVSLSTYVTAAMQLGIVSELDWVKRSWSRELFGEIKDLQLGDNGTHYVTSNTNEYFAESFNDTVEMDTSVPINVYELEQQKGSIRGDVILDIDLDAFSLENPAAQMLRVQYEMSEEDILTTQKCHCEVNAEGCQGEKSSIETPSNGFGLHTMITGGSTEYGSSNDAKVWDILAKYMEVRDDEVSREDSRFKRYQEDWEILDDHICLTPIKYRTMDAINQDMDRVASLIKQADVKLVTLSRSMSGFTPTHQFPEIEEKLLATMKDSLQKHIRVVYIDHNEQPEKYIFPKEFPEGVPRAEDSEEP